MPESSTASQTATEVSKGRWACKHLMSFKCIKCSTLNPASVNTPAYTTAITPMLLPIITDQATAARLTIQRYFIAVPSA